ncbi:MAG: DUF4116 domain-containing protein [Chlamydiae bacterium]|nr:DUF4116 domain-containing protein [Chlamydiota bacterium]
MNRVIGSLISKVPCYGFVLRQTPSRGLYQSLSGVFSSLPSNTSNSFYTRNRLIGPTVPRRQISVFEGIVGCVGAVAVLRTILGASHLIRNADHILKDLATDSFALKNAHPSLTSDKNFMMKAVSISSFALEFASETLKDDPELIIEAVRKSHFALEYASPALRANRSFMLKVLEIDPWALKFAAESLCGSRRLGSGLCL